MYVEKYRTERPTVVPDKNWGLLYLQYSDLLRFVSKTSFAFMRSPN